MKVSQLTALLNLCPPDAEVFTKYDTMCGGGVLEEIDCFIIDPSETGETPGVYLCAQSAAVSYFLGETKEKQPYPDDYKTARRIRPLATT